MITAMAKAIVEIQEREISKCNNIRFTYNGYEYRVTYKGGFASYIAIDRRKIGTRNFKYFGGLGGYQYHNVKEIMEAVSDKVMYNQISWLIRKFIYN